MYFEILTRAIQFACIRRPSISPEGKPRYRFSAEVEPSEVDERLPVVSPAGDISLLHFSTERPIGFFGVPLETVQIFDTFNLDLDTFLNGLPARIIGRCFEVDHIGKRRRLCSPMVVEFLAAPQVPTYESFREGMDLQNESLHEVSHSL